LAQGTQASLKTSWYLLGPAFVAAIAYVDPGNVAANVSSGTQFGYLLLWVIVAANVMAGLVQYLSAKLGLVTGRSLPAAIGKRMSRPLRLLFWAQAEIVAMATDVAEVIGGAIALRILFDLPLPVGGIITGVISLLLLAIKDRRGQLLFERVITGLLLVIAVGFAASFFVATPPPDAVVGGLVPRFRGTESVLLAVAILGATVMPHAVYLHSGLALDRHGHPEPGQRRRWLLRVTRVDVVLAMAVAGTVNAAMLLVAAINLLHRSVPMLVRRLITLCPAVAILALGFDPTRTLVLSQVVLSFGIPFAVIPLIRLTSNRKLMGSDANHPVTTVIGWAVGVMIILLNLVLVYLTVAG
jgi:manganese transport protein